MQLFKNKCLKIHYGADHVCYNYTYFHDNNTTDKPKTMQPLHLDVLDIYSN